MERTRTVLLIDACWGAGGGAQQNPNPNKKATTKPNCKCELGKASAGNVSEGSYLQSVLFYSGTYIHSLF